MTTLSESTMARSRCTTVVLRLSCGSYSTSATSDGSAGRGDTHSRPSPTWGGLTIWGPSARGLAASVESGLPTGAGMGRMVSGAPAFGTGRPKPPLGPTRRDDRDQPLRSVDPPRAAERQDDDRHVRPGADDPGEPPELARGSPDLKQRRAPFPTARPPRPAAGCRP